MRLGLGQLFARAVSPLSPACWITASDKSRSPSSGLGGSFGDLTACLIGREGNIASVLPSDPDLDLAWMTWCSAAKEGPTSACKAAGGSFPQGKRPFREGVLQEVSVSYLIDKRSGPGGLRRQSPDIPERPFLRRTGQNNHACFVWRVWEALCLYVFGLVASCVFLYI